MAGSLVLGKFHMAMLKYIHLISYVCVYYSYIHAFKVLILFAWIYSATPNGWEDKGHRMWEVVKIIVFLLLTVTSNSQKAAHTKLRVLELSCLQMLSGGPIFQICQSGKVLSEVIGLPKHFAYM